MSEPLQMWHDLLAILPSHFASTCRDHQKRLRVQLDLAKQASELAQEQSRMLNRVDMHKTLQAVSMIVRSLSLAYFFPAQLRLPDQKDLMFAREMVIHQAHSCASSCVHGAMD